MRSGKMPMKTRLALLLRAHVKSSCCDDVLLMKQEALARFFSRKHDRRRCIVQ